MSRALQCAIVACLGIGVTLPAAGGPLFVDRRATVGAGTAWSAHADVATGTDGGYLVVWQDGDWAQSRVMARAFDATGAARGPARQVSGGSRGYIDASMARVAALGDGRFVVAWSEAALRQWRVEARLLLRLVDATGTPLGVAVDAGAFDSSDAPALVVDEAKVVTVAWVVSRAVLVRRFDGAQVGLPPLLWHTDAPGGGYILDLGRGARPAMVAVADGVLIARATAFEQITISAIDAEGRPRRPDFRYATTQLPAFESSELRAIRLLAHESGRFQLVWHEVLHDYDYSSTEPRATEMIDRIRLQAFGPDGSPVGAAASLLVGPSDPDQPDFFFELGDVAARRDGSFLATWSLGHHPTPVCGGPADRFYECPVFGALVDGDVHATVFAADGTPLGEALVGPGSPLALPGGAAVVEGAWWIAYHDDAVELAKVALPECGESAATLCLADRFRVQVEWRTDGADGQGLPQSVTSDTGAFWFFSPANVEMLVKVLDGTAINGKHWVFFASLTDVELDLVVTDTATGEVKRYHNPRGTLASRADTGAFGAGASLAAIAGPSSRALGAVVERAPAAVAAAETSSTCPAGAVCLAGGRFVVTAKWRLDGSEGAGAPIAWTGETGAFWFFSRRNVELAVKVLDGRGINGRFWVFYASLSDVDFDLEVLDTTTGQRRTYRNPRGTMASRADVEAF